MPLARANTRWIRAIGMGVAAELATAISVILVVAIHSVAAGGQLVDTTSRFSYLAGGVIGIIGGTAYVFLFSRWIGRCLLKSFVAHGLVVAAVAVLIHVATTLGSTQGYDWIHVLADVLKLAGGAAGGWQASRQV